MMQKVKPTALLQILLGLVFLSAAVYRIFFWQDAVNEINNLALPFPSAVSLIVVMLEIGAGMALLTKVWVRPALVTLSIFLALALAWVLLRFGYQISGWRQLFVFRADPTDIFLHFVYLIILAYLYLETQSTDT